MNTTANTWKSAFLELHAHFASFDDEDRATLQSILAAPTSQPQDLAKALYSDPEAYFQKLCESFDPPCWELAEALALTYAMPLDISWSNRQSQHTLKRMGLITPASRPGEAILPAALAAIIAPKIDIHANTLLTLIGFHNEDEISKLASIYHIANTNPLSTLLSVSEMFASSQGMDSIVNMLPNPDYLGALFMILELGGICYWEEIFGFEKEDRNADSNVIAFMPSSEKAFEKNMMTALLDHALLFRIEHEFHSPLALIPEELWISLWNLGNEWILEWTRNAYETLIADQHNFQSRKKKFSLQSTIKWMALELPSSRFDRETFTHTLTIKCDAAIKIDIALDFAFSLGAFQNLNEVVVVNPTFLTLLDGTPQEFAHEVLNEWVRGFIKIPQSAESELSFSEIMGLDESWRKAAISLFEKNEDFLPPWLSDSSVESMQTGHGYLRDIDHHPDEIYPEFEHLHHIFQNAKLLFLDMLSLLEKKKWVSLSSASELFQMCCATSIFSNLSLVLSDPDLQLYVPLYRASFVGGDPVANEQFLTYTEKLFRSLLEPLGAIEIDDTKDQLWFCIRPDFCRIPTLNLSLETREQLLREITFNHDLKFEMLSSSETANLRIAEEGTPLRSPFSELKKKTAAILFFDGNHLRYE